MGLAALSVLGFACTLLSFGWLYALEVIPFFQTTPATVIVIATVAIVCVISIIAHAKRITGLEVVMYLVSWPFCFASVMKLLGFGSSMTSLAWWQNGIAIAAGIVLLVVFLMIINAMDTERHSVTFWVTFAFFVAVAVGVAYVLNLLFSREFATMFALCAMLGLFSMYFALDIEG